MPAVPLTTVLQNRQVFLPDPVYALNAWVSGPDKTLKGWDSKC